MMSGVLVIMSGCAGPRSVASAEKTSVRPSELDLLDGWVGQWEDSGEVHMPGSDKAESLKGTSSASWKCDKRFLVEEMNYQIGSGAPESAVAVRTWDPHANLFRSWYFDNHGMVGHSKMTYDAAGRTWHMTLKNNDPETCAPVKGEMRLHVIDDRNTEWTFTERDARTSKQRVEIKGTSRRAPAGGP